MNQLVSFLKTQFPDLSQEATEKLEENFTRVEGRKDKILLREGDVSKNIFFIAEGVCRYFINKDGKDISTWFSFENEFVTSFTSFFPKTVSRESIELLTDTILYKIEAQKYAALMRSSIELERVSHFFVIAHAFQLEERLYIFQTKSASEKYEYILKKHPHIIQRIPNKHLASYLGMTRETLSRVRSKLS